jgi:carbonic anhydrase/acetyltransferase-like protein (isoleucine patch superfamily)
MALYAFEGKSPKIGEETYIAETADVIGDVVIGNNCYIGPGARIKGDYGSIRIGNETSVQENCIIHARPNEICRVGNQVTVGHGAILHNCTVHDGVIIGMGAIVSDWAIVGENALVAEGAVVRQFQQIPEGKVAVGVPAKVTGLVSERVKSEWPMYKSVYVDLARRYRQGLKRIE